MCDHPNHLIDCEDCKTKHPENYNEEGKYTGGYPHPQPECRCDECFTHYEKIGDCGW